MVYLGLNNLWEPAEIGSAVIDPAGWIAEDVSGQEDWVYQFSRSDIEELGEAIRAFDHPEVDLLSLQRSNFNLPSLAPVLAEIREEILYGRGFAILRGFPVEQFGKTASAIAFWAIGQYLGDGILSQNKHGHVLGHRSPY